MSSMRPFKYLVVTLKILASPNGSRFNIAYRFVLLVKVIHITVEDFDE